MGPSVRLVRRVRRRWLVSPDRRESGVRENSTAYIHNPVAWHFFFGWECKTVTRITETPWSPPPGRSLILADDTPTVPLNDGHLSFTIAERRSPR
jgi:hypothetical protein